MSFPLILSEGKRLGEILNDVFDKVMDGDLRNERSDIFHYIEKNKLISKGE